MRAAHLAELDEAWVPVPVPVLTPDGPGVPAWENSDQGERRDPDCRPPRSVRGAGAGHMIHQKDPRAFHWPLLWTGPLAFPRCCRSPPFPTSEVTPCPARSPKTRPPRPAPRA
ncbi:hypothetical protein [Streptomyces sp. NPDC054962]